VDIKDHSVEESDNNNGGQISLLWTPTNDLPLQFPSRSVFCLDFVVEGREGTGTAARFVDRPAMWANARNVKLDARLWQSLWWLTTVGATCPC